MPDEFQQDYRDNVVTPFKDRLEEVEITKKESEQEL